MNMAKYLFNKVLISKLKNDKRFFYQERRGEKKFDVIQ